MNGKKQLEKYLKCKISDRTYFRIISVMRDLNIAITRDNLEVIAIIKVECKKHRIPLKIGLSYYLKIADIQIKMSGKELYFYLKNITKTAHRTTIIRWFKNDFHPEKIYNSFEISKVLIHSFLYIIRSKNNGIVQCITR